MISPLLTKLTLRTVLIYCTIAVFATVFLLYVLFQARFFLQGPQIELAQQDVTHEKRIITLVGNAENIVRITLNGRQIYTDSDGNFQEALVLENGYTVATLEAEDRYGRVTRLTEGFVFTNTKEDAVVIK